MLIEGSYKLDSVKMILEGFMLQTKSGDLVRKHALK